MSENQDLDKSEKATPHKLEEARKKGQASKSIEINTILQLLAFSSLIIALGPKVITQFSDVFKQIFNFSSQFVYNIENIFKWFLHIAFSTIAIVLPIYLINLVIGVVSTMFQTKPIFSTHPLKPDFKKLNPVNGFKKIFSMRTLFELFKALLKIVAVGSIFYIGFSILFPSIQTLMYVSSNTITTQIISILSAIAFLTILFLFPISLIDFLFSKWEFAKKMRMSKRDVKEEHKRREGHPEVRSKRKELHQELVAKTTSLSKVKDSDVIITNPTHFAVALKYDKLKMAAPIVVSKGTGELARKIKELGRANNKTIIRKPPLARLLYKKTAIGSAVSEESFDEIAEIYRWLISEGKV
ncbi:flagellar biosynthesis protein FlhB [Kangiella sp. HZ709]|uniref:EscU/YscU/HrcU family type III secretion system export apparatus switch protein n=1 Tax=Kangiella sp. HZ709 TaxID=2666328 RepID=UPI0012AF6619|nr:EscU/YscU/HrcU family type III secretion system export apparatus switch protein [Kangiella sp. HZ709]MRX26860.1 flagellar type III secretion system protein FlhB [Kangiella sp. HZ709]